MSLTFSHEEIIAWRRRQIVLSVACFDIRGARRHYGMLRKIQQFRKLAEQRRAS